MIIKFLGLSLFALHWWTREAVCRWDHANKDHLMWRHASTIHLKSVNHQNTNPNKSLFFTPIPLLGTNGPLLSYPATLYCRRTRSWYNFRSHYFSVDNWTEWIIDMVFFLFKTRIIFGDCAFRCLFRSSSFFPSLQLDKPTRGRSRAWRGPHLQVGGHYSPGLYLRVQYC